MDDVPDFMPLSEFNLRPDKQIVSVFLALARDDGYVYAEDLAADKVYCNSVSLSVCLIIFSLSIYQVVHAQHRNSVSGEVKYRSHDNFQGVKNFVGGKYERIFTFFAVHQSS